jgi:hypothetical protein
MPYALYALERRLPPWLHSTYRGAVAVLGLGFRGTGWLYLVVLLLPLMLMVGPGPGVSLLVGALGVTVCAGAAGGMLHGILRPLHRWRRFGSWLRSLLSIGMAVIVAAVLWPRGPLTLADPVLYLVAIGIAVLAGGGLLLADDRRPGRPTPRQFESHQNRARLWAAAGRARARVRDRSAGVTPAVQPLGPPAE